MMLYQVVKDSAERVFQQLQFGLSESSYRKALAAELRDIDSFLVQEEYYIPLYYTTAEGKKVQISCLRIDILVTDRLTNNTIVLELKTLKKQISEEMPEYTQMKRYVQIVRATRGAVINFSPRGLEMLY